MPQTPSPTAQTSNPDAPSPWAVRTEGEVHPDYRSTRWVPSWFIPSRLQWIFTILGILGSTFLGLGFAPFASTPRLPESAVQAVAAKCAQDATACAQLDIRAPWYG